MNETSSLLKRSAAFLWRHPVLLLPVLLLRILDFLIWSGLSAAKNASMRAVAPRSVLGGFTGKADLKLVLVAAFFSLLPVICEVALFLYAMAVSARWSQAIEEQRSAASAGWSAPLAEIGRGTLITFAVSAVTVGVGSFLSLRGGVPVQWMFMVTWCFVIMASWFLVPAWLRLVAHAQARRERVASRGPAFAAVLLGFVGFAACVYLGIAVQRNLELAHKLHGQALPFAINLAAAALSSLPLAFAFVGLIRFVADRPGWHAE